MDQVKINVVDTEVLQGGIKALLNALVEGVRELTRDLPKKNRSKNPRKVLISDQGGISVRHSHPLTKISDRGTPD